MKILVLCTGNSCRSQMAEGFLKSFDSELKVYSAGTNPSSHIHPKAVQVMAEIDIDISNGKPENVDEYLDQSFDYLITVCDNAKETCPMFLGEVREKRHIGFEDPADAVGTEEKVLDEFRRIRDEIKHDFGQFYNTKIKQQ
jgi:arsenate reductase (thioredoxin)